MTDRLAIVLGLVILAAFALDFALNHGDASMFLLRKFAAFIEYLSFWR